MIIAKTDDDIEMLADADLILNISREELDAGTVSRDGVVKVTVG